MEGNPDAVVFENSTASQKSLGGPCPVRTRVEKVIGRGTLAEGGSTMTKFMICLQFPHRKLELRPVDARACSQGHWKRRAAARTGPTLGSEAVQLGRAVHARMWQRRS